LSPCAPSSPTSRPAQGAIESVTAVGGDRLGRSDYAMPLDERDEVGAPEEQLLSHAKRRQLACPGESANYGRLESHLTSAASIDKLGRRWLHGSDVRAEQSSRTFDERCILFEQRKEGLDEMANDHRDRSVRVRST
jgi:hypothetical protein